MGLVETGKMQQFWDVHASMSRPVLDTLHHGFLGALARVAKGKRILDCGCGSGALTSALYEAGAAVTGIDFSESMLRQARTHFPKIDFRQVDLLHADLGEKFDVICGMFVLHEINLSATPTLLHFMQRHLSSSGFAWFHENSFFNPAFRFVRKHLVGRRFGIPKFGSEDETPFDEARWDLYRRQFRYCARRCPTGFVLFSRIHEYLIRRGGNEPWRWIDRQIGKTPYDPFKRYLSYYQCIYFSDSAPLEASLGKTY